MKTRKRLKPFEAIAIGIKANKFDNRYYLTPNQIEKLEILRTYKQTDFQEIKRTLDKNGNVVTKVEKLSPNNLIDIPDDHVIKRVSTNVSTNQQWIITEPSKAIEDVIERINFEAIIKKYIEPIKLEKQESIIDYADFDRLVYTDVHIGMTTNENGYSLYGGKWDKTEIENRLENIVSHIIENQKSNTLIIDDLGDFMDGWDGETTRKGHKLPQNMDNEKAFDVGLYFKVALIDNIAPYYNRIICHNICNDNHSGSFGYVVNSAFKSVVQTRYEHIDVINIRKFIDHYTIGKYCFILSHGKDSKSLKFGFKPVLDAKQIEKINGYISHHKLHEYKIEFSKGDSHQKLFDESTSDSFDYYNYGALSPSSEWVQTNFKRGKSFFEFFNFINGQKKHNPFVFDWDANRQEDKKTY